MPPLTIVGDVLVPVERLALIGQVAVGDVYGPDDALLAQVAHEKLQTNQSKDAQAEDGQDHHIRQLLHRLDQGAHDGLQAWRQPGTQGQTMQEILGHKPSVSAFTNHFVNCVVCYVTGFTSI